MKALFLIGCIWIFATISQAKGQTQNYMLPVTYSFCRDSGRIETCADQHGEDLTIEDVFTKMASNLTDLADYCDNSTLLRCVSGCLSSFRASKYGYLFDVCAYIRIFQWENDCWDQDFPQEAISCFHMHYPPHRIENLYPTPFRVYDRHTIARDCFSHAPNNCQYFKSMALLRLMPSYYVIHPYPNGFNHTPHYMGFPGYSN